MTDTRGEMDAGRPLRFFGKTAKLSAMWDLAARISAQGVSFLVSIFLARVLTPADFGITAAARFFVALASRVTQLGLNASLVRREEIREEHVSSVFVTNLVIGSVTFAVLYLSSGWLGAFFQSPEVAKVLKLSAVAFLIHPFGSAPAAILDRHLRYRTSLTIQWTDGACAALLSLAMAFLGFGYWSLVLGALAGTVISTTAKVCVSPCRLSLRFSWSALRDVLGFGLGFHARSLLDFSSRNLDNLVVGQILGVTALGFYDKAFGLMRQLTDRMAFDASLMRIFALIRNDPVRFRSALVRASCATSIISVPLLSFAVVAADYLVIGLFGPQWSAAVRPFQVFALVAVVTSVLRPVSAANDALGLVWQQAWQRLLYVALMIIGVAIGSTWGVTGASLGLIPATLTYAVVSVALLLRHSQITFADGARAVAPALATGCGVSVSALAAEAILGMVGNPGSLVSLAVMSATAAAAYFVLLLWSPFGSVTLLIRETVDDVAPWLRRWVRFGALRPGASAGGRAMGGAAV